VQIGSPQKKIKNQEKIPLVGLHFELQSFKSTLPNWYQLRFCGKVG
jgi:hypothetical protein